MHNLHIVRYYQSWRELITDPDEIRDLNFTDTESEGEEEKQEPVKKVEPRKKKEETIIYPDSADEEYFLDDEDL